MDLRAYLDTIQNQNKRHLMLTGPSGSGKTMMLRNLWEQLLASNLSTTPVFIPLNTFDGSRSFIRSKILDEYCGSFSGDDDTGRLLFDYLKSEETLLILDGYNEASTPEILLQEIRNLAEMPGVQIVISCITPIETLLLNPGTFEVVATTPLPSKTVQEVINRSGKADTGIDDSLLEMLSLPMFLKMYTAIEDSETDITSVSELFKAFYDRLWQKQDNEVQRMRIKYTVDYLLPCFAFTVNKLYFDHQTLRDGLAQANKTVLHAEYDELHADLSPIKIFRNLNCEKDEDNRRAVDEIIAEVLIPNGLLVYSDDNKHLSFPHQNYFEYNWAKHWVNEWRNIKDGHVWLIGVLNGTESLNDTKIFWIGNIIGEGRFADKTSCDTEPSPVEKWMQAHCRKTGHASDVAICVEIMKKARKNHVTADYSGLDLSLTSFVNCNLENSIFDNATVDIDTFSPPLLSGECLGVLYDMDSYIISGDGMSFWAHINEFDWVGKDNHSMNTQYRTLYDSSFVAFSPIKNTRGEYLCAVGGKNCSSDKGRFFDIRIFEHNILNNRLLDSCRIIGTATQIVFSGNGQYIAAKGKLGVGVWNVKTCELMMEYHKEVDAIALSYDGTLLAVGVTGPKLCVFNVMTGQIAKELPYFSEAMPSEKLKSISFSKNNEWIAASIRDEDELTFSFFCSVFLTNLVSHTVQQVDYETYPYIAFNENGDLIYGKEDRGKKERFTEVITYQIGKRENYQSSIFLPGQISALSSNGAFCVMSNEHSFAIVEAATGRVAYSYEIPYRVAEENYAFDENSKYIYRTVRYANEVSEQELWSIDPPKLLTNDGEYVTSSKHTRLYNRNYLNEQISPSKQLYNSVICKATYEEFCTKCYSHAEFEFQNLRFNVRRRTIQALLSENNAQGSKWQTARSWGKLQIVAVRPDGDMIAFLYDDNTVIMIDAEGKVRITKISDVKPKTVWWFSNKNNLGCFFGRNGRELLTIYYSSDDSSTELRRYAASDYGGMSFQTNGQCFENEHLLALPMYPITKSEDGDYYERYLIFSRRLDGACCAYAVSPDLQYFIAKNWSVKNRFSLRSLATGNIVFDYQRLNCNVQGCDFGKCNFENCDDGYSSLFADMMDFDRSNRNFCDEDYPRILRLNGAIV